MVKQIAGKTVYEPGEGGFTPPTPEEVGRAHAAFEEFDRARRAVPESGRAHLSARFGDWDFEGTEFEQEVAERHAARGISD